MTVQRSDLKIKKTSLKGFARTSWNGTREKPELEECAIPAELGHTPHPRGQRGVGGIGTGSDQVGINSACATGSRSAQPLRQAPLEVRLPKISRGKLGNHVRPYARLNHTSRATTPTRLTTPTPAH